MMNNRIAADYLLRRDIEIIRGDTFTLSSRLSVDGELLTLPNTACITFAMFSVDGQLVIKKTCNGSEQDENGYIGILITPEETAEFTPSRGYRYEVEYYIDNNTVYTALTGSVSVKPDKITPDLR